MVNVKGQRQSQSVLTGTMLPPQNGSIYTQDEYNNAAQTAPALPPNMPAFGPQQGNQDPAAIAKAFAYAKQLGYTPQSGQQFMQQSAEGLQKIHNELIMDSLRRALTNQKQAQTKTKPLQKPGRSRWGDENMTGM